MTKSEYMHQYHNRNRQLIYIEAGMKNKVRNAYKNIRALQIVGTSCVKCGNNDPMVLEFNHINGGGTKHTKEIGSGGIVHWILRYPEEARDTLETLCANCHAKKHSVFNSVESAFQILYGIPKNL